MIALYARLLQLGVEPRYAGRILENVSKTKLISKYKERLVDVLMVDFEATWNSLKENGVDLGLDPSEVLAMVTSCNFEPQQEFGY